MNKCENVRYVLCVFLHLKFKINLSRGRGKCLKYSKTVKLDYSKYFHCFKDGQKIMSKSTDILENIENILHLSQKYLIFEISVAKEALMIRILSCTFEDTKV